MEHNDTQVQAGFGAVSLSPELSRAVEAMGYESMTDIQAAAIPAGLAGKDIIGRSATGTGKTAAFGIPAVEMLSAQPGSAAVLVLCPTRELAMQISGEVAKFARFKRDVHLATLYGGQAMPIQLEQLRRANFVVGTPGRVMDHMRRGTLKLDAIKMVILDEADEMLNMGFLDDIRTILADAPQQRQTLLFSATMPPAILQITREFQRDPVMVAVDGGKKTLDAIEQYYYLVPPGQKPDALNLLLQAHRPERALVFCNTRRMVDELVEYLVKSGFKATGLHGEMSQMARTRVMQDFRLGLTKILVATDVAARGIDVEDVEGVYNYDIPQDDEYYIHRIGRTGRAGKRGAAHILACNRGQVRRIREIRNYIRADIKEKALPSREEILNLRHGQRMDKVREALHEPPQPQTMEAVEALIQEGYDARQIAATLLSMMGEKERRMKLPKVRAVTAAEKPARKPVRGRVALRLNLGKRQDMAPNFIVSALCDGADIAARDIGRIDVRGDYSLIELTPEDARKVLRTMQKTRIRNNRASFTLQSPGKEAPAYPPERRRKRTRPLH